MLPVYTMGYLGSTRIERLWESREMAERFIRILEQYSIGMQLQIEIIEPEVYEQRKIELELMLINDEVPEDPDVR